MFRKSRILIDTLVSITAVSDSKETAEKAIDTAFSEIEKIGKLSDFFSPDSEISRINRNAGISGVKVSSDILDILESALLVSEESEGAFDITIGPVDSLYDFHKQLKPDETALKEKLLLVNYRDLTIDRKQSSAFLERKGMLIDPGGITKGYAADRAVEALKKSGIRAGLVSVAGDIRAFGLKPDNKPWKIGIRNPRATGGEDDIMATVDLTDMAISTSGDYERFFISDGKRYHHLLSPKTGLPAGGCRSVSIIAGEGVLSDSFATAVFILGPEKGLALAEKMGLEGVIVDGNGKIHITPGLRGKIEFKRAGSLHNNS